MAKITALYVYYMLAWAALLFGWGLDLSTWGYGLISGWFFHMLVCSVILHKYFTHRTFSVNTSLHWVFTYLGTLGLNGSVLAWSNMHRLHHSTSDRVGDPHDPRQIGFLKSLFVFDVDKYTDNVGLTANLKHCRDLIRDPAVVFFHKYTFETITLTYIVAGLISLHLLMALLVATAISFIGLFFTTYVYHFQLPVLHYRNSETSDRSYNNWLTTILFPGEAYHNNHHNDPSKYNTAEKWYEYDLTSLIIDLIKKP